MTSLNTKTPLPRQHRSLQSWPTQTIIPRNSLHWHIHIHLNINHAHLFPITNNDYVKCLITKYKTLPHYKIILSVCFPALTNPFLTSVCFYFLFILISCLLQYYAKVHTKKYCKAKIYKYEI